MAIAILSSIAQKNYNKGSRWRFELWCKWHKRWEPTTLEVIAGYMTALVVK